MADAMVVTPHADLVMTMVAVPAAAAAVAAAVAAAITTAAAMITAAIAAHRVGGNRRGQGQGRCGHQADKQ